MPLDEKIRNIVISYVLRDIAPAKRTEAKPFDWFLTQFAFIQDAKLEKELAEAFYQARMMEKLRGALGLKGNFNSGFIKFQIVLYASIYEAVIDHFLEANRSLPEVKSLVEQTIFKKLVVLSKNVALVVTENGVPTELVACRPSQRTQSLKEIKFDDRIKTAVAIGLVPPSMQQMISKLYASRNGIHLIAAAAKEVKPAANQASSAYLHLKSFLAHVRSWKPPAIDAIGKQSHIS